MIKTKERKKLTCVGFREGDGLPSIEGGEHRAGQIKKMQQSYAWSFGVNN